MKFPEYLREIGQLRDKYNTSESIEFFRRCFEEKLSPEDAITKFREYVKGK